MSDQDRRRRVTYCQLEHLWQFLSRQRDLATGYNKTSEARELSKRMWKQIAHHLNNHNDGAVKDWKGWCKYWNDYKSKLKKFSKELNKGEGQSSSKVPTDIEKKYFQLLGYEGFGILPPPSELPPPPPGMKVEPFEEDPTEPCAAEAMSFFSDSSDSIPTPDHVDIPAPADMQVSPEPSRRPPPRRARRIPQCGDAVQRALILESRRMTKLNRQMVEMWRLFISEFREFKDIFREYATRSPTNRNSRERQPSSS